MPGNLRGLDRARLELMIQYALSVARQELAATHLVKYVYLGDLAYANAHGGETFTGARWVFLHYGPYSKDVHDRVPGAAGGLRAEVNKRKGPDGSEFVRYRGGDEQLAEKLRDQLPSEVATAIRWAVQDHGGDMPGLLEDVYRTDPMVRAAPGEELVFLSPPPVPVVSTPGPLEAPKASWKVRREEKAAKEKILAEVRRRLDARTVERHPGTGPAPRYDELYAEGLRALEALAGPPVPEGEGEATFSESVWKSSSRRSPDGATD